MIEFDHLKQLVTQAEADIAKFESGNKAAGTRVRKSMQEIKSACQAIREKVLETRGGEADAPAEPTT